jgi:hypothetical protein
MTFLVYKSAMVMVILTVFPLVSITAHSIIGPCPKTPEEFRICTPPALHTTASLSDNLPEEVLGLEHRDKLHGYEWEAQPPFIQLDNLPWFQFELQFHAFLKSNGGMSPNLSQIDQFFNCLFS